LNRATVSDSNQYFDVKSDTVKLIQSSNGDYDVSPIFNLNS